MTVQQHDEMIARIERAENDAFVALYEAAAETCGTGWYDIDGIRGVWSTRDDDPGYSCVINLADAPDPAATLEQIEREARAAGVTVLGIDGSPDVSARIGDVRIRELGYMPDYQECMWGTQISTVESVQMDDRLRIETVGGDQRDAFARILNLGYNLPAEHVRGQIFASTLGLPGWTHYLVSFDGTPGAASVLYTTAGVADLFVATTVPEFRGRGAQTALIRQRLHDGLAAGCDIATSQTVVDNASPRNMARHGFQPLYHRWIYGKVL